MDGAIAASVFTAAGNLGNNQASIIFRAMGAAVVAPKPP